MNNNKCTQKFIKMKKLQRKVARCCTKDKLYKSIIKAKMYWISNTCEVFILFILLLCQTHTVYHSEASFILAV